MNVTDGKFYTKTSGGVVKEVGGAGAVTLQAVTTSGGCFYKRYYFKWCRFNF